MTRIVFADVETTGTDPARHQLWEVGLIVRDNGTDTEYLWQVPADLTTADPAALRIGHYYERREEKPSSAAGVAGQVAELLADSVLVAANVGFDAAFLDAFLRANGQAPAWNYHLVEIESMAAGASKTAPPWKLNQFLAMYDVAVAVGDRHTALGDAAAVRDLYDAILHA